MVLLLADMQELKADPQGELEAVVIESKLEANQGPVATLLVKNGTLTIGEEIWAEEIRGKVKALTDDAGKRIEEAGPSQPVVMLGFGAVPSVGAKVSSQRLGSSQPVKAEEKDKREEGKLRLKLIIKADVAGTLEAIKGNMSEETVEIIDSGVGEIGEADILMAEDTGAWVIGFNVPVSKAASRIAEMDKVTVQTYKIIYELLEDVE